LQAHAKSVVKKLPLIKKQWKRRNNLLQFSL
jgi:hypothetical protein